MNRQTEIIDMFNPPIDAWRLDAGRSLPQPTDLARLYDKTAWRWQPSVDMLGYTRAYINLFAELAKDKWMERLGNGARVLDGGIGTAALSTALLNTHPNAYEIHGVDISQRMLEQARKNLDRLRHLGHTAQLRCDEIDNLSSSGESFDMVMSAHLLEHSRDPARTIDEMTCVLHLGAPLLIVTTRANRTNALHGRRWGYHSIEAPQLRQWMQQAGLSDVRSYALGGALSLPGLLSEAFIGRKTFRAGQIHSRVCNTR